MVNNQYTSQTVWIVRHGNRQDFVDPSKDWNHDPPLSEDGVIQAGDTGDRLKNEGIRHIFASPFYRTVQTAHAIADVLDLPVKIEYGTCEWLNPEWFQEMIDFVPPAKLKETFPRIDLTYVSQFHPVFPETKEQMQERCARVISGMVAACADDFLAVGHGASVVWMSKGLAGKDAPVACPMCALVKIRLTPDGNVMELNGDISHLSGGESHRNRLV